MSFCGVPVAFLRKAGKESLFLSATRPFEGKKVQATVAGWTGEMLE